MSRRHPVETDDEVQDFQSRYGRFSDRLERLLMQGVIIGLVGLTLLQTLLVFPTVRRAANAVEALEGIPASDINAWQSDLKALAAPGPLPEPTARAVPASAASVGTRSVTVLLTNPRTAPDASLLVDGKPVGNFATGQVTAVVTPGQTIAVDGSKYRATLEFRVGVVVGLSRPAPGVVVSTRSNRKNLGSVEADH
ncbi:MAG TPA: hypothetical protein VGK74_14275 [Symbiobacteriaceae bacterium]|jgi:hypothetical protein